MAKDTFHDTVKKALEKEGWTITHEFMSIKVGGIEVQIDLGAEKLIAAERNEEKIAVEIKSFLGKSTISEFHMAVGQYMNYEQALKKKEPERLLYLAVPETIYNSFFSLQFIQEVTRVYQLKVIVYDIEEEVIVKWQK